MKIDFIVSSLRIGGAERVLVTLTDLFTEKGLNVRVNTFLPHMDFQLDSSVAYNNLNTSTIKIQTIRYLYELFKFYKKKENRPDVVISFMTQTSLSSIIICKIFGIKVIACEHTNHLRTSTNVNLVRFTRKYIYRCADAITILTKFDFPYYRKINKRVVVMPNPNSFKIPETNILREKTILAVGNLDKYKVKGFDNLISLIRTPLKNHPNWKLKIAGSGEQGMKHLKKLAKNEDVENQIEFLGHCHDIADLMNQSSIFVLSSRMEGLPMALIEAMSQGMACIAFDCISGPSDIISNEENGLLIKNQDLDDMQVALCRLMNDKELRIRFGQNAMKITKRYSPENIYKKWCTLLNRLE